MVFGLFKKSETADVIFKGGKIYTLDPDAPWAEAVACKDGRVMAVGNEDEIEGLEGSDTEIIDIQGGTLLPGFIDTCGHPVMQAFEKACLILYADMSLEEVLDALDKYIKANPDNSAYFAYGFNTSFVRNKPGEELRTALDGICADKPVVLLDIGGFEGWFNTKSMELVKAAIAEEEEEPPIITLPYVLNVLAPINFDKLLKAVVYLASEYCQKGYTAVFDCGAPDYLHTIYQDTMVEMLQADMLKQRFYGSFLVTRNVSVDYITRKLLQKRTSCGGIEEYINCNVLKLIMDNINAAEEEKAKVTADLLKTLAEQALDQGFDIHIDAVSKEDIEEAVEALSLTGVTGSRKIHATIAHSENLSEDEKMELLLDNELSEALSTLGDFNKKYRSTESAKDIAEAVDKLTIDAAIQLGISDDFGSIEVDKFADFVIFENNPIDCGLPEFRNLNAKMTVIGGEVVYDRAADSAEDWLKILKSKQEELQEQMLED